MRQKRKESSVFKSNTFSKWFVGAMALLFASTMFCGCAEEKYYPSPISPTDTLYIVNEINKFESRKLVVSAFPVDTLVKSVANFTQGAYWKSDELEMSVQFDPRAYLTLGLSKELIEVKNENELDIELVNQKVVSKVPYVKEMTIGEDVVKSFTFDDGQVATVKYGDSFTGVIVNGDTLETPHAVIDSVVYSGFSYELFGEVTELEKPFRMVPEFLVYYSDRGTTEDKVTGVVELKPWYKKVITTDPLVVEDVRYEGKFVGCPIEAYEVKEWVKTNKGELNNTYKVVLTHKFNGPKERVQPGYDSIFDAKSVGSMVEEVFSETKNADGFTVKTMSGKYTSSNKGKVNKTIVENVIDFTYLVPVKLETQYGTHNIAPLKVSFEELGFSVGEKDSTENEIAYRTLNLVTPKLNDCVLDVVDEVVVITRPVVKEDDVIRVDSTYTLGGNDDNYEVEKTVIWSDGSKTTSKYLYTGMHSISAINFGEVITSSLDWREENLAVVNSTKKNEEKKFSEMTKFAVVYTTNVHQASASNGNESGNFAFKETSPKVSFVDGNVTKEFDERKFVLTGLGADVGSVPTEIVKNGVAYNAYPYDYKVSYVWNNKEKAEILSEGKLLKDANVVGDPRYDAKQTWNGNTTTITVTKTTPNSHLEDEVETYKVDFTISLKDLIDGKVYANNISFGTSYNMTSESTKENSSGFFVIKHRTRDFEFNVSNGEVNRIMQTTIEDAEIKFDDGSFSKTFDVHLSLNKDENFGATTTVGEYFVTPHNLILKAQTVDGKLLNTKGKTDIYVKVPDAKYETSQTWKGNTTTVKVVKTSTNVDGSNEVDTYSFDFTVALKDLVDGKVYADNTSFSTTKNVSNEQTNEKKDGFFVLKERNRNFVYKVSNKEVDRDMQTDVRDGEITFNDGSFSKTFDVYLTLNENENLGNTFVDGNYNVTPHTLSVNAKTIDGHELNTTGRTDIYVEKPGEEPEPPHLGKPKGFTVTATYDPASKVTRRAFCFNWEDGVTYAVCDYETMLPKQDDFMFKVDSYQGYNSVGYNKNSKNSPWEPARGSDDKDAIRWYSSNGKMISGIDKDVSCKAIGWKNSENGNYALIIKGYTYKINGYNITVTAPNGESVTFNSHHD